MNCVISQDTIPELTTYDSSTLALLLRLTVGLSSEQEGEERETCQIHDSLSICFCPSDGAGNMTLRWWRLPDHCNPLICSSASISSDADAPSQPSIS